MVQYRVRFLFGQILLATKTYPLRPRMSIRADEARRPKRRKFFTIELKSNKSEFGDFFEVADVARN